MAPRPHSGFDGVWVREQYQAYIDMADEFLADCRWEAHASWAEVAFAFGITEDEAIERWGDVEPNPKFVAQVLENREKGISRTPMADNID